MNRVLKNAFRSSRTQAHATGVRKRAKPNWTKRGEALAPKLKNRLDDHDDVEGTRQDKETNTKKPAGNENPMKPKRRKRQPRHFNPIASSFALEASKVRFLERYLTTTNKREIKALMRIATWLEGRAAQCKDRAYSATVFHFIGPSVASVFQFLVLLCYRLSNSFSRAEQSDISMGLKLILMGLVYIDRLRRDRGKPDFFLVPKNLHRLVLTSVLIAQKYLFDDPFCNRQWGLLVGITTTQVTKLERKFCELSGYAFFLTDQELEEYSKLFLDD